MFHSAALKLTAWYLALIMAVSLVFSLALYNVSTEDLERNISHQVSYYRGFLSPYDLNNYSNIRQQQLDNDTAHLRARLLWLNIIVLALGGLASYGLARRTLEPIEEALEAQKRFAADASHELRTPLTAMQSEIEVALRDPKISKAQALAQLKSNLEEVAKLKDLSEGLLKLAASSGAIKPSEMIELKTPLAQAVERLSKSAGAKKINIQLKTSPVCVVGDSQNLTDLTAILLDNAIKYSPSGSLVRVACGKNRRQAYIKVSDEGQGIAADDLPHIFERFYRTDASRTKNKENGYGLGLALAKKIVELHSGHIEVSSSPGKGSVFSVYLPLA